MNLKPDPPQDIFISYAHVDNQFGWVTMLLSTLKSLFKCMSREREPTIYFDQHSLRGNQALDESLKESVQAAGILLIVMSESWCSSSYCTRELEWFIEATGGIEAARRRIFIIQLSNYRVAGWPEAIRQNVGKVFFQETLVGHSEPISLSFKETGKPPSACTELARDVWNGLAEMGLVPAQKMQAQIARSQVNESSPIVFVSEVHRQLADVRNKLVEDLRREGYRVLPDQREFRHDAAAAERDLPIMLAQALLVVQLHSDRPIGIEEFDESFDRWLLDQRASVGKSGDYAWLRWRRPNVALEQVSDLNYRQLLFENNVVAEDESHLTSMVLARIQRLRECAKLSLSNESGYKILVRTKESTRALADDLSDEIDSFENEDTSVRLEATIVQESVALATIEEQLRRKAVPTVGLFVVYGDTDEEWAEQQMKECRRLALKRRSKPPLTVVYVKPVDDKPRPQSTPGRFEILRHDQTDKLHQVLRQALEVGL